MKKFLLKVCFFVLPVLFCTTAFAAAPAALNVDFTKYENAKYNFQIYYPATWKISEGFMGAVALFRSPPDSPTDQFSENANIVVEDLAAFPGLTLDKYVESGLVHLAKAITDYNLINIQPRVIAGKPAKILIYTGRQGVFSAKFMQAIILSNNTAYVVTFTAEEAQYKNYEEIGTKILNSILIK